MCPMQAAIPKAFASAPCWRRDSTRGTSLRTTACMSCLSRLACSFFACSCSLNVRTFLVSGFGVEVCCGGVERFSDARERVGRYVSEEYSAVASDACDCKGYPPR